MITAEKARRIATEVDLVGITLHKLDNFIESYSKDGGFCTFYQFPDKMDGVREEVFENLRSRGFKVEKDVVGNDWYKISWK